MTTIFTDSKSYTKGVFLVNIVLLIGYGQAQKYEGDPCDLHDGTEGLCELRDDCIWLTNNIRQRKMRINDIVLCSFQGSKEVICCGDERPPPGRSSPSIFTSGTGGGDIIFVNNENESSTRPPRDRSTPSTPALKPTVRTTTESQFPPRIGPHNVAEACEDYSKLPAISPLSWNILGGTPTTPGEFPHMAALGYPNENTGEIDFDCGGTIISDRFILTAAHCVPQRRQPTMVRLGKVFLFTNDDDVEGVDIDIQNIMRHPNYKSMTKVHDIALIQVALTIPFSVNIRPACLRTDVSDISPTVELLVTGWGSTQAERTVRSTVLLKTNVTSVPLSACNQTLLEFNQRAHQRSLRNGLITSQLCCYDPRALHDGCQGDSGGPLQIHNASGASILVGIVSFGISCGTALPSIYTRVASYIDWIEPIVWQNAYT